MMRQVGYNELQDFAAQFWNYVKEATIFAFHGAMGAGKTTLINALCKQKGVQDVVGSPTFSIINQYAFQQNGTDRIIYHMDLYRLKNEAEVVQAGVEDNLYSGEICMIEWPERAPDLFDDHTIQVYIELVNNNTRKITVKNAFLKAIVS